MVQQDQQCLCSTRTQIPSLAWHSELKDLALPLLWHRLQLQLGSDPWPEKSMYRGLAKKEKKNYFLKITVVFALRSINLEQFKPRKEIWES